MAAVAQPVHVLPLAQDRLAASFTGRVQVVLARPFNHIGPRQTADFLASAVAQQVAEIERGLRAPEVRVGNLSAKRDFTDVRDVVAAYVAALERGTAGEAYNVCSGIGVSVRDLLKTLIELSGLEVEVAVAKGRVRAADVPRLVGCADKLRHATGWGPRHELRETLAEVLADWRKRCVG